MRADGSLKTTAKTVVRANYYPHHSDPRLTEDFRVAYDHIYALRDQLQSMNQQLQDTHQRLADAHGKIRELQAGPSTTKIQGLNVRGIPPTSGAAVTNLSKIPVLTYDSTSGDITWVIPN